MTKCLFKGGFLVHYRFLFEEMSIKSNRSISLKLGALFGILIHHKVFPVSYFLVVAVGIS
jgi:hypothetical protein